jgi:quercetin dioxygenase-like cupin family protein
MEAEIRSLAVAPDDGFSVESPTGGTLTFKLMSEKSGGAITVCEAFSPAGEGPPLHVHAEDELIYVVEGTLRVKVGEDIVEAPPGAFVFLAHDTPHTWQNVGGADARFFIAVFPAATTFEEFFQRYDELPEAERGLEAFARLAAETKAFEVVGPPLAVSDPL